MLLRTFLKILVFTRTTLNRCQYQYCSFVWCSRWNRFLVVNIQFSLHFFFCATHLTIYPNPVTKICLEETNVCTAFMKTSSDTFFCGCCWLEWIYASFNGGVTKAITGGCGVSRIIFDNKSWISILLNCGGQSLALFSISSRNFMFTTLTGWINLFPLEFHWQRTSVGYV